MMIPIVLEHEQMNEYIRFLLRLMQDKYHIKLGEVADDIKKDRSYIQQFVLAKRNIKLPNLLLLQDAVIDLYGPILVIDVQLNKVYLEKLFAEGNFEELNDEDTIEKMRDLWSIGYKKRER